MHAVMRELARLALPLLHQVGIDDDGHRERCAACSGSECGDRLAEADVIAKEQGLLPHREHRGLLLVEIGLVRLAEDVREVDRRPVERQDLRSEENTSELQSLMRNSYAGCC